MTAEGKVDRIYAVTLSWATQDLLKPTVVAIRTKADSHTNGTTKITRNFARNVMGKRQLDADYAFSNCWS